VRPLPVRDINRYPFDLSDDDAGNGLSRLFMTIAAAFAELERDRIRKRITQVKRDQKARGRFLGARGRRSGCAPAMLASSCPTRQSRAIGKARRMRGQGKSLRHIAAKLAADGHRLNPESARRMLTRSDRALDPVTVFADSRASNGPREARLTVYPVQR
jgi:putative DNA-invertase from lambdoid prophage Rac